MTRCMIASHEQTRIPCPRVSTHTAERVALGQYYSRAVECNTRAHTQSPDVLHLATLSAVLACLMRHFRTSLASLPLLAQPITSLPLGTWAPDAAPGGSHHADLLPPGKEQRRAWRRLQPLHTVTPATPLTQALGLLLEAGVSALPVVDEQRRLLDVYARSDITSLAQGNAYSRLQWEDVTVSAPALHLAQQTRSDSLLVVVHTAVMRQVWYALQVAWGRLAVGCFVSPYAMCLLLDLVARTPTHAHAHVCDHRWVKLCP